MKTSKIELHRRSSSEKKKKKLGSNLTAHLDMAVPLFLFIRELYFPCFGPLNNRDASYFE